MTKLDSKLPPPGDECIVLSVPYIITGVKEFKSDVNGFAGIRVALCNGDNALVNEAIRKGAIPIDGILAIPLWTRAEVGRLSKLGAFIGALGDDTDLWKGKIIEFMSWSKGQRVIQVMPEIVTPSVPKEKGSKSKQG